MKKKLKSPKNKGLFKKGQIPWNKNIKGYKLSNRLGHGDRYDGKTTDVYGHILIYKPNHPTATARGYIFEHRLIMEQKLGRYLTKEESIHHINGITNDNRIENLELVSWKEHALKHKLGKDNHGKYKRLDIHNNDIINFRKLGYSLRKIAKILHTAHPVIINRIKSYEASK